MYDGRVIIAIIVGFRYLLSINMGNQLIHNKRLHMDCRKKRGIQKGARYQKND
jgi:hypothetical protein